MTQLEQGVCGAYDPYYHLKKGPYMDPALKTDLNALIVELVKKTEEGQDIPDNLYYYIGRCFAKNWLEKQGY